MQLFGFEFRRKVDENPTSQQPESFAPQVTDDGSVSVSSGGVYGTSLDLDGSIRSEAELITKYREATQNQELDTAVTKILNEAIVQDEDNQVVKIVLDKLDYGDNVKKMITEEFDYVTDLLDFNTVPYKVFGNWYVDGRLYYHVIIDPKNPKDGIKEMRYLDPRKIRKVRETKAKRMAQGVVVKETDKEYYVYSDRILNTKQVNGNSANDGALKIAKDSIVHVTSGLTNPNGDMIVSYLQKALRPLNQLRALEDSLVIYRISRAPERRIFYIDVGNLPKAKAEQHLRDIMNKFKNKLVYDASTGAIKDDRKFMTMLEDFWLPRREGGKGTEITTLPGGQNLGQIDDITYFQKNLYKSLNVPIGRMDSEQAFNLGRSSEISRDELEFSKFITRLRGQFSQLFIKTLGVQLMLQNIVTPEAWEQIKGKIRFDYNKDNFYEELKETEILRERITMLRELDDYAGKYFSHKWVRTRILRQTEEEQKEEDKQIAKEVDIPQYQSVEDGAAETETAATGGGEAPNPATAVPGEPVGPDR